ncbi:acyl-CoA synthetase [Burkholderia multivorans]|uniref:acyl-CoA synthetase n=1 Tax=Burkholderia multivorans TaxID=87883 RepID=UPI0019D29303|nr:long-chain fatty acid--CoA ligase [Burkholderia multivorans]MBN6731269.1 long-chain fatty acid--CoA ligase [Burkholderia multivorans]MBN6733461.1 long-chain fatty acid--CoA ligase [Burkholderia multivorans]MBN7130325.1 long-chain fatty acid--CoA ligase [Burkholderia multivorans]MBN8165083.1 long-chain fatty acid--CoA ligase [Burkholderia multivorans]MBN8170872.1 long-chain fatty acid--CoA ligase [Burkholderia multivorans]
MQDRSNVGMHLAKRAELNPQLEAVVDIDAGKRFTYAQISERADRVAEALTALGLKHGDRLAVLLPNGYRYVEIYYGAARAGIILVPLNTRLVADEIAYILQDSGATAFIGDSTFEAVIRDLQSRAGERAIPVQTWMVAGGEPHKALDYDALVARASGAPFAVQSGGSDPLFIMYTSGTTGHPKGAVQTHDSVEWSLLTVLAATDMRYRDRYLISMPLFHIAAFNNLGTTLYKGGTVVILSGFEPEQFWQTLRDERISITLAVPAMLYAMRRAYDAQRHQPLALRWILTGASPIPPDLITAYGEMGFEVYQGYGLTEAGGVGCIISPDDALSHVGSTGKSFFHTQVRVVDENGRETAPDVPGELVVRGKHLMAGYWNRPAQTAETLRDGWLHTGDIAIRDRDGFIYIRDRLKDMIISGGENIYPAEIEAVLLTHPLITEAAVIGVPSARWGESPFAVVVRASPELDEAAIIEHCAGKLARFKIPKGVQFVDAIPRTATGKALKRVLRSEPWVRAVD